MENTVTLVQLNSFLKTLSVWSEKAGRYFGLSDIIFYNEAGIIVNVGRGYFDDDNDSDFTFSGTVIKKIKEDFSKKQNYVIKDKSFESIWDNNYILYIYVDNVELKYKGVKKQYNSVYKIYEVNGFTIEKHIKMLNDKIYEYKNIIETEIKKIEIYNLPLEETELKNICDNIIKYNKLIIEENKKISSYIPLEKDFE